MYNAFRIMGQYSKVTRKRGLGPKFIRRITLVVTEENGCMICSNVHTKKALEEEMINEEVKDMTEGVMAEVPVNELPANMFAQPFAESR